MLSRVANSIYWMNRYIERAENYARFMSSKFNLILDMPPNEQKEQWEPLLVANADNHLFYRHFDSPARDAVLQFMSFDRRNSNFSALYHKKCRKFEIAKKSPHLRSINQII